MAIRPCNSTLAGADISFGAVGRNVPRWSNDGQDSFVTFNAGTIAGGVSLPIVDHRRRDCSDSVGVLPFTAADIEFVLPHPVGYADYSWSNHDGMLAYLKLNYDSAGNDVSRTILIRSMTNPPSDVAIYTRTNAEGAIWPPAIRAIFNGLPNGSRIAFNTNNSSSYGGVWTIRPDGTGLLKVKTNSGTMSYSSRGWSPRTARNCCWKPSKPASATGITTSPGCLRGAAH